MTASATRAPCASASAGSSPADRWPGGGADAGEVRLGRHPPHAPLLPCVEHLQAGVLHVGRQLVDVAVDEVEDLHPGRRHRRVDGRQQQAQLLVGAAARGEDAHDTTGAQPARHGLHGGRLLREPVERHPADDRVVGVVGDRHLVDARHVQVGLHAQPVELLAEPPEHPLRGVDARHREGPEPAHHGLRDEAGAAAHVEHALVRSRRQRRHQALGAGPVAPEQIVVVRRAAVEPLPDVGSVGHRHPPSLDG